MFYIVFCTVQISQREMLQACFNNKLLFFMVMYVCDLPCCSQSHASYCCSANFSKPETKAMWNPWRERWLCKAEIEVVKECGIICRWLLGMTVSLDEGSWNILIDFWKLLRFYLAAFCCYLRLHLCTLWLWEVQPSSFRCQYSFALIIIAEKHEDV